MSVLTKVFVVLLTVVSIVLSALVVSAFAKQDNWRQSAMDYREAAQAAAAKATAVTEVHALEVSRAQDRQQRNAEDISRLESEVASLKRELADRDRALAEAQNRLTVEQGTAAALTQQNTLIVADLNAEREFSAQLGKRNSELERQNIDLNDRVKELTANITMARSQVRALQQQLAAVTQGAGADVAGTPATTRTYGDTSVVEADIPIVQLTPVSESAMSIRGEVTAIQGNLASLSVGSADGVVEGMKFLIYRPAERGGRPQYLATLRVDRVQADESVGLIEAPEGDIRRGDLAKDMASLAMSR